jgi:cytochrome c oxidase subunit IV
MLRVSGEATNTNCIVFGLTRPGLEPTIYQTRGEHANHCLSIFFWTLYYISSDLRILVTFGNFKLVMAWSGCLRVIVLLATFCNIIINIIYIRRELVHVVYTK